MFLWGNRRPDRKHPLSGMISRLPADLPSQSRRNNPEMVRETCEASRFGRWAFLRSSLRVGTADRRMKLSDEKGARNPTAKRDYRRLQSQGDLVSSFVRISETDLHILADRDVEDQAKEFVLRYRMQIESYIARHPAVLERTFATAGRRSCPAHCQGDALGRRGGRCRSDGGGGRGDLRICRQGPAGCRCTRGDGRKRRGYLSAAGRRPAPWRSLPASQPLSYKVGVVVPAEAMPAAVCTSSGTVGHSLSFGEADSVTVLASSTALADAVATRLGNEVGLARSGEAGIKTDIGIGPAVCRN